MPDLALVERVLGDAWRRDSGVHGEQHWWCVAATALDLLPDVPGADAELVFLFGLLHDTRRENDKVDPEHGPRAAAFTRALHADGVLRLEDERLERLCFAIDLHAFGQVSDDPTVGACWDADRLHLPRVGMQPLPSLFSTSTAHGAHRLDQAQARRAEPVDWAALLTAAAP